MADYVYSTQEEIKEGTVLLTTTVNTLYRLQNVRIGIGNSICQLFKAELGIDENDDADAIEKKQNKLLNAIREEYKLLSDGINDSQSATRIQKIVKADGKIIKSFTEHMLVGTFEDAFAAERACQLHLTAAVHAMPLWQRYFQHVHGIGAVVAGVMMANIDIAKCEYASSMMAYCGLDVVNFIDGVPDNRARSGIQAHLVPRTYVDKFGETKQNMGLSHNRRVKSKLIFIGGQGLRRARNPFFTGLCDNYKNRLMNDPGRKGIYRKGTDGLYHRYFDETGIVDDNIDSYTRDMIAKKKRVDERLEFPRLRIDKMSVRYMIKVFVACTYEAWKMYAGEVPKVGYEFAKYNLEPHTKIREIDGNFIICDYRTGEPVRQKPFKERDSDSDVEIVAEENESGAVLVGDELFVPLHLRKKMKKGTKVSERVKHKTKIKLDDHENQVSAG